MSNSILILSAYLALANLSQDLSTNSDINLWRSFKEEHGKQYESQNVEAMRRTVFTHNLERIRQFKENQNKSRLDFEVDLNHLADVGELEIKHMHKGFKMTGQDYRRLRKKQLTKFRNSSLPMDATTLLLDADVTPDEVDWRKVPGRVSRVKNQGSCGSCWTFASTGALEGQEKKQYRFFRNRTMSGDDDSGLVELSEQNLVDCVKKDYGCNGGIMADAFEFIHAEGGIDDELSYPYEGRTRKCRFKANKVAMSDSGFVILPQGDEQKLKEVVAKFGPVAVAIDASSIWFQFYRHGVYYDKHCKNKPDELDHAVLVVGYGTDPKKGDYWIVKNSWGPKYGEQGYIRMARNRNNNCGIASVATIPTF